MKKIFVIAGAIAVSALTACGGAEPKAANECVFPNTKEVAPLWVCDAPVEGAEVTAVGSVAKSSAGHNFMKTMAVAAARDELARNMKVYVTNMVKSYVEATGAASAETVDQVNTSVSKQITKETLVGSRIFRTVIAPDGSMYALVGFDKPVAKENAQDAIKNSMKNDGALWQQFKAKKAQDELAAEIANSAK
jgi:hypothetical protein